jgi:cyclohexyl-isocyanide hydratase
MLIGIPIYGGVDLLDVAGPYEMFSWADLDVQLFAQEAGLVTCRCGLSIYAATRFENAPAFDVLWVPGGLPDALARLMGDPERIYLDFLLKQSVKARYVASVCEGALLLAAAGLLADVPLRS